MGLKWRDLGIRPRSGGANLSISMGACIEVALWASQQKAAALGIIKTLAVYVACVHLAAS